MAYVPKESGGDFQNVPAGTHPAICYRVIDLGTQEITWEGKIKHQRKILVSWEIADAELRMDDGRPFSIGNRYTWSMSDKARLRADLESWRGVAFTDRDLSEGPGGFEIQNILGKPCLLSVVHTTKGGKTYANIKAVSKLPRGMAVSTRENPEVFLWLTREEFSQTAFDGLTDGLKAIIQASPEYKRLASGESVTDDPPPSVERDQIDDEIPF
jgi:hypothetical protein